jgi:hypothetical protein
MVLEENPGKKRISLKAKFKAYRNVITDIYKSYYILEILFSFQYCALKL